MQKKSQEFNLGKRKIIMLLALAGIAFSLLAAFVPNMRLASMIMVMAASLLLGYKCGSKNHDAYGVLLFTLGCIILVIGLLLLSVNMLENAVLNSEKSIFAATIISPFIGGIGAAAIGYAIKIMKYPY